ncbi:MAG: PTS transporter subunit EIIC, partial [Lachnospiraceae bacterium]|nr:PTS transporter subunit EIIC [Lachnospiraceae bacterium]
MGESKIVEKFTMFASKLGNEIHLRSLRDAFATIMPLYILAGLAVLINNTIFQWLLSGDTLTAAQYWGTLIVNGTLNISSLLIAPVIGYMLSQNKGYENPLAAAVISLSTLVVMMPNTISITPLDGTDSVLAQGALTFGNIGTGAMFAGVIIGLVATEVFIFITSIKKLQINLGDSIPPAVGKSFNVLVPFILVISAFALVSAILNNIFHTDLVQIITSLIQEPLRTATTGLVGCVLLYSLGNFLWILGIHQSVIYSSILEPLLIVNMTLNMAAYA